MTYAVLSAELFKLRKRPAVWLIAALWVILGLVFGYLFPYLSSRGGDAYGPNASASSAELLAQTLPASLVPTAIAGWPLFGGALALILGVLVSGSEYGWNTVKTILAQRPSRTAVLAGKTVTLALMVVALVLTAFVADALAAWLIATVESKPASWPPAADLARGLGVGWLVVATWCLGGLTLGTLLRGTALPIGLGLVWALVIENLVRGFASLLGFLDVLQRWLPGTNAGAVVAAIGAPDQGSPGARPGVTNAVSGTHAGLVLAAYLGVFSAISLIVFRRRDVS